VASMFSRVMAGLIFILAALPLVLLSPRLFNNEYNFVLADTMPIVDARMITLHKEAKSAMNALLLTHSHRE
jgi:hypothetical protein